MISQEKIQEIRRLLKKGEPEGEVKEQLLKAGYSKEDIDKVFTPHKYDMRSWYLYFAILVSIGGIYFFAKTGGLIILILGGLLFFAYYKETERLKREK